MFGKGGGGTVYVFGDRGKGREVHKRREKIVYRRRGGGCVCVCMEKKRIMYLLVHEVLCK